LPLIRVELQRRKRPWSGPLIHDSNQVLYLPFDHDDGVKARDRSGHNEHGTIYNATHVAGKIAYGLSFDGIDNRVMGVGTRLNLQEISVAAWFKPTGNPKIDNAIFATNPCGVNTAIETKWDTVNDQAGFHYGHKVGWQTNTFLGVGVKIDKWHHYAFTFKDGVIKLYINGNLFNTITNPNIPIQYLEGYEGWAAGTLTTENGCAWNASRGIIDEIRIYNRVLSQAEIRKLMNRRF